MFLMLPEYLYGIVHSAFAPTGDPLIGGRRSQWNPDLLVWWCCFGQRRGLGIGSSVDL